METNTTRRGTFKKIGMGLAALFGAGSLKAQSNASNARKEVVGEVTQNQQIPLFSSPASPGR